MIEGSEFDSDAEDGGQRSWGTSITVGGTTYATSLFWQPLQNPNDPMQEIEESSNTVLDGADLFCIKSGRAPQFGICVSQEGYKSGQYAAACSLTTAMDNLSSFVGVFKTNGGWWYVCVRNDIILSDGDMLFLSEDEAKSQFMSMLAVPDWGMKIAPAEWNIEETQEVNLAELLQRGAKAKLQKIKGLRGTKLLLIVVLSLVIGGWLISSLIDKLLFTPVKKPVVVPIRPKPIIEQQVEVKPVPKPWERLADPKEFMQNCFNGVKQITAVTPPGWRIGVIACNGVSVSTSWTRELGFLSVAKDALERSPIKLTSYSFDPSGNAMSGSLNLPKLDILESPPAYNMTELRNIINNEFQTMNLPISLVNGSTSVPSNQPNVPPTVFAKLVFSLNSPHDPTTWIDLLTKYSGIEINLITYTQNSGVWHYEGAIYVL